MTDQIVNLDLKRVSVKDKCIHIKPALVSNKLPNQQENLDKCAAYSLHYAWLEHHHFLVRNSNVEMACLWFNDTNT